MKKFDRTVVMFAAKDMLDDNLCTITGDGIALGDNLNVQSARNCSRQ